MNRTWRPSFWGSSLAFCGLYLLQGVPRKFFPPQVFLSLSTTAVSTNQTGDKNFRFMGVHALKAQWIRLMVQKSCKSVEVGSLSHYLQGFFYIPGGAGFSSINGRLRWVIDVKFTPRKETDFSIPSLVSFLKKFVDTQLNRLPPKKHGSLSNQARQQISVLGVTSMKPKCSK